VKELVLSIILVSRLFFLGQNAFAKNLFYGSSFEKLRRLQAEKESVERFKNLLQSEMIESRYC
jgi:hypothetical protein